MTKRGPWHTIPADPNLQARVQRVGMRVLPEFERQMADDDPDKIAFSFWAVDDQELRVVFCSSHAGLIVISRQTLDRLQTDDQLAAVLADGVAYEIQRQGAVRLIAERAMLGADTASVAIFALSPATALILGAGGVLPSQKYQQHLLEEQRGRVALSLLADAGYDPWQAPEAWRLLEAKHLPADLSTLKYPNRSGYQLSVLHLQYRQFASTGSGIAGPGR
jgi:predicted Zn-dependent protease